MRFLVLSVFLSLQGCVGAEIIHDKTNHIESPNGTYLLMPTRGEYTPGGTLPVKTKDELQKWWGKPDAIWFDGGVEKWRYINNISWAVFMPELIVPLPIGIPTGHSSVTFTFHGSNITSEDADETNRSGFGCGYYIFGIGCMTQDQFHGWNFLNQGP